MTTKQEELSYAIKNLDDEATEIVLQLVYKLSNGNDLINEDGEVIVDDFYKKLLSSIDETDSGQDFTYEELKKELGIM
ncbi:hypothetical protein ACJZQ5_002112 [Enterococcus hirae]|uniref:Uncharacterized protein n=2 Tax=Enterococcus hirae TaxID=1354 RepID=I6RYU0_ENTHA|nr:MULTISPECIES: hypothetical protein [Enterococcus]MWO10089.1 hypothetical protein [Escherichia coli]AFM69535.1 hypothetical protein EHR_02795 [Enterococcus hirae ATCC 9790]EMF0378213.1 hypothetical protein [Enterococcus hirae]EMF0513170.1 hypothetical protein [Enterococcus hirae]EOH67576.1 hypothetical protein UAE_02641 [Enterococcus hirae ATCC 9790]